jgi:hypothetical protein
MLNPTLSIAAKDFEFFEKTLAAFRALMILCEGPQLSLRKGGTSVMRYEFDPLNKAMIGALQDCLLSARPR